MKPKRSVWSDNGWLAQPPKVGRGTLQPSGAAHLHAHVTNDHDVTHTNFAATPKLWLAVDGHTARRYLSLGVTAPCGEASRLQQGIERDVLTS